MVGLAGWTSLTQMQVPGDAGRNAGSRRLIGGCVAHGGGMIAPARMVTHRRTQHAATGDGATWSGSRPHARVLGRNVGQRPFVAPLHSCPPVTSVSYEDLTTRCAEMHTGRRSSSPSASASVPSGVELRCGQRARTQAPWRLRPRLTFLAPPAGDEHAVAIQVRRPDHHRRSPANGAMPELDVRENQRLEIRLWLALNSSTVSVVSARDKVQTAKISLPPGFTLGATWVSICR